MAESCSRGRDIVSIRLAVLVSGRGSNLQAIIDAIRAGRLEASVEIVVSDVADAPAVARARGLVEDGAVRGVESPARIPRLPAGIRRAERPLRIRRSAQARPLSTRALARKA